MSTVGTKNYNGQDWFWPHDYRHYLRDANARQRKLVHNGWLKIGVPVKKSGLKISDRYLEPKKNQLKKAWAIVRKVVAPKELGMPIPESVNEFKYNLYQKLPDKQKVLVHLISKGNKASDAKKMVNKYYDKVSKAYKKASLSKKAEIISVMSAKMESVNEANNIDKIKDIVKNKQYKRIGGVIIDMQTANAIMKVHKALTGANKKKYEKLSISKMASIAYKLIK